MISKTYKIQKPQTKPSNESSEFVDRILKYYDSLQSESLDELSESESVSSMDINSLSPEYIPQPEEWEESVEALTEKEEVTNMEEYLSFSEEEEQQQEEETVETVQSHKIPVLNYRCHEQLNLALIGSLKPEFVVYLDPMIPQPNIRKNLPGVILKQMKVSESEDYKTKYNNFLEKKYQKRFFDKTEA